MTRFDRPVASKAMSADGAVATIKGCTDLKSRAGFVAGRRGHQQSMALGVALPAVTGVTHRQVDVGTISMHVAEAGSGPPLLLVHGWPQNWFCWHRVVPLLADRYRLIMPDLRGHGWSDAPRRGYDKEQLATDLLGLLDRMELGNVGYVGHDWGGWAGFLACLRAPQRFSGLVALGIIHPFQHVTPAKVMQAWRGAYQVALSTPVLSAAVLRSSPQFIASMIPAAARNRRAFAAEELRRYGQIFQEPDRAHATTQLYRTLPAAGGAAPRPLPQPAPQGADPPDHRQARHDRQPCHARRLASQRRRYERRSARRGRSLHP